MGLWQLHKLGRNQLEGSVPAGWRGGANLMRTHMNGNNLSGSIAASIGKAKSLPILFLPNNLLSKTTLEEIGQTSWSTSERTSMSSMPSALCWGTYRASYWRDNTAPDRSSGRNETINQQQPLRHCAVHAYNVGPQIENHTEQSPLRQCLVLKESLQP